MFVSFFPRPRLLLMTFAAWSLFGVLLWYFAAQHWGPYLSLGNLVGYGTPAPLPADATDAAKAALQSTSDIAANIWFYQYFIAMIAVFVGAWRVYSPHTWQGWSIGGSALILFVNWFLVQLDVLINEWFGTFYDMIQRALGSPGAVQVSEIYWQIAAFLQIALVYVFVATLFRFFVSHFIFRWRTAMNDYYMQNWQKLRHIEGASQRVQEDTMRFATIMQDLGVSVIDSVMTLIAFLPLLWMLSAQVKVVPIVGEVHQGLVFVAILWSVFGTALVAIVGIKLPGLQFRNQRVEAAYRKELVYGEDNPNRAQPPTVQELFANVRRNYFRLYFHYMYFNVARIFYLQIGNLVPYIAMAPTVASGVITLGVLQQIIRAFSRVESSFQLLINSWTTIVELLSVHKRLKAFEAVLHGEDLPEIDRRYLEREAAGLPPEEQPAQ